LGTGAWTFLRERQIVRLWGAVRRGGSLDGLEKAPKESRARPSQGRWMTLKTSPLQGGRKGVLKREWGGGGGGGAGTWGTATEGSVRCQKKRSVGGRVLNKNHQGEITKL